MADKTFLVPGSGYVNITASRTQLIPGSGYVNETVSAATTYTYTATGGVTLAGAATLEKTRAYTATGGATLAGAATTSYTAGTVTYEYTATGGLVLAGAATTSYQAYQFARPSSDTDAVGWLPSTPAADLYTMIDEVAASDTDYIYTTTVNADAEVALSSVTDPSSSNDHIIRVRARAPYGGQVKVGLYQTTTLIAEWTESLTTSFETYPHTLAGAEADAITNYSALRLRFTALAA